MKIRSFLVLAVMMIFSLLVLAKVGYNFVIGSINAKVENCKDELVIEEVDDGKNEISREMLEYLATNGRVCVINNCDNINLSKTEFLKKNVYDAISYEKQIYPYEKIGIGVYKKSDFSTLLEVGASDSFAAGVTTQLPFVAYVLSVCENSDIDIYNYKLYYHFEDKDKDDTYFKDFEYGSYFTIVDLLGLVIQYNDKTAYNMLINQFYLPKFQKYLDRIEGTDINNLRYGYTTIQERKNEVKEIVKYMNSHRKYSPILNSYWMNAVTGNIVEGIEEEVSIYFCKTAIEEGDVGYTCCNDIAILDDMVIMIFTQDMKTAVAHKDTVQRLSNVISKSFVYGN